MIEAVVFDLGGTLIEYAGEYTTWPELEIPGMTAAHATLTRLTTTTPPLAIFQAIGFRLLPQRWSQATLGGQNLTVASLLGAILETAGFPLPAAAILETAAHHYEAALCQGATPIPHGRQLLTSLRETGYRLSLISNTMFAASSHINDLERFGLAACFDTMLFSADANKWKPTPAPFLHVLAELGIEPANAVYVGDDPAADVVGGRAAGMKTVYFPSSQRFAPPDAVQPDAIIGSLMELPGCLVTLNGA